MWRRILNKMPIKNKEIRNVVNKAPVHPSARGTSWFRRAHKLANTIICFGFFRLDSFLLPEISVPNPLIYTGITLLISIDGPIYPVAPAPYHLPTSLKINYNFNWISASIMGLWFAFLFEIHVTLVFSTPNPFLPVCIIHASISQDSYDVWRIYQRFLLKKTAHLIQEPEVNFLSSRESSVIRKLTYLGHLVLPISLCAMSTSYIRIQAG